MEGDFVKRCLLVTSQKLCGSNYAQTFEPNDSTKTGS
jgi:hypothetical protein